ncbi:S-adenosyl-L-methionine-dependent methyltransferase [Penicillium herquei]|nr:S-adenosyl-L-methionine-dependent methyltransferase [Penicillium herquei]
MSSSNIVPDVGGDDVLRMDEFDIPDMRDAAWNYKYKNGRGFNAKWSGAPDDLDHNLDLGQHVFGLLYGGQLSFAPTSSLNRVLDVGAGSAKWAMDMGAMYPNATVTAVDLFSVEPDWLPNNVKFDIVDVNKEWNYSDKFDLVHVQQMRGEIKDWAYLCGQAMNTLTPGGYLEIHDFTYQTLSDDNTLSEDSWINKWNKMRWFNEGAMDMYTPSRLIEELERAGFVDIEQKTFYVPTNTWPADKEMSELGKFRNAKLIDFLNRSIATYPGYSQGEAEGMIPPVQNELGNRRIHAYDVVHVFTAAKPYDY